MTPHAVVSLMVGGAGVKGGVKFYRGSPGAARSYVEADRSRADDYYLAEGTGLADRLVGTAAASADASAQVRVGGTLDGDGYERWVAGHDPTTGRARGRLRTDDRALRFVEVVVNGPKTWSLAAALHPEIAAAYDTAQDRAAHEIVAWLTEHATTRIGPQGRQVQVPVDVLEAVVVRHHTSRAGDPHRHLHLQVNARVQVAGRWRGLHSVGIVDSVEAINGIGHAAVATDPDFRAALTRHGYTMDPATGDLCELAPWVGAFSARTRQIARNTDRFEAAWRADHLGQEPGPTLRRAWDRRAWATARPDKVIPTDGTDLTQRWIRELTELGFRPPTPPTPSAASELEPAKRAAVTASRINHDKVADLVLARLAERRSAWNGAEIRGEVERIIAATGLVTEPATRRDLAENLTAHTLTRCVPLLDRPDVPFHVRALTSPHVQAVEADLIDRLTTRAATPARVPAPVPVGVPATVPPAARSGVRLDVDQRRVVGALAGPARLVVVEGAAGAGKTTTLAAARTALHHQGRKLVVVAPTLKAAEVAGNELGTTAFSAMRLAVEHGYRRDPNGRWTREPQAPSYLARLSHGDVLLVDEAGMLDQDTAQALLTIADEHHAHLALIGDRQQLPAIGRGGVLDLACTALGPDQVLTLDAVHRFTDPAYADLTLLMRSGERPGYVFDTLHARGDIVVHPSEPERLTALTALAANNTEGGGGGALVIADTREYVATLNAAIRDHRHHTTGQQPARIVTTSFGETLGAGDLIATRLNDRDLAVANRDRWTITATHPDGSLTIHPTPGSRDSRSGRSRVLPAAYVNEHVELAHATTVHGAQGETADTAHLLLTDTTNAKSAYVAMTRGRHHNTAHLVANDAADAREQWIATFTRDRADLGPAHATRIAEHDIDRFGPAAPTRPTQRAGSARPRPEQQETVGERRGTRNGIGR